MKAIFSASLTYNLLILAHECFVQRHIPPITETSKSHRTINKTMGCNIKFKSPIAMGDHSNRDYHQLIFESPLSKALVFMFSPFSVPKPVQFLWLFFVSPFNSWCLLLKVCSVSQICWPMPKLMCTKSTMLSVQSILTVVVSNPRTAEYCCFNWRLLVSLAVSRDPSLWGK